MRQFYQQPILFAVGINYKTAPIAVREKFYIQEEEILALTKVLKQTLSECVVISTCNRTEIYGVTTRTDLDVDFYKDLLIDFKNARQIASRDDFFGLVACSACQQLFQVATSIDSKIVGDTQILGQIRSAFQTAEKHSTTGKILHQMFQRSFKLGKQVRSETNLHRGAVSISMAAVELAAKTFGSLSDKKVLLIGAGETARLTAECLVKKGTGKITIANRTRTRAEEMLKSLQAAADFSGEVINFADFKTQLNSAEIVISSTSSPAPILQAADLARQQNKILLVDIAVPRDIDPRVAEIENVILRNIDHLNSLVDANHQRRMADLPFVQGIIRKEMADFLIWYYSLPFLPAKMQGGAKPDAATQSEIVRVKEFLIENLAQLHHLALGNGVQSFSAHSEVVSRLVDLKNSEFKLRYQVGA